MLNVSLYQIPWNGDPAEDRIHHLGGSDMGTILGINPFKSKYTLWLEKTGQIKPNDISETIPVMVGHLCEDAVAKLYEHETGHKVEESVISYMCKEYPYLQGHVDRLCIDDKDRGLECKTTSSHNHYDYENGEIPPYYYAQCQFYMLMTGRNHWDLATLRDNSQFYVNLIERDDTYIETMLQMCEEFWTCVQTNTTPVIDGSNSTKESIIKKYSSESISHFTVDLNPVESIIDARESINAEISRLQALKQMYDNEIRDKLGNHDKGESEHYFVTWKAQSPKLDTSKAKILLGENYNLCLGESTRVLKYKKKF